MIYTVKFTLKDVYEPERVYADSRGGLLIVLMVLSDAGYTFEVFEYEDSVQPCDLGFGKLKGWCPKKQ